MRVLISLAAVLLPGLATASDLRSGPCPWTLSQSASVLGRPVDCLLDERGGLRAVLYESTNPGTQEIAVFERGLPARMITTPRALSFLHVPSMVMAQIEGPDTSAHAHTASAPPLQPLPYNPPRPAPANVTAALRVTNRTYDLLDRIETETVALEDGGTATVRYTYYNDSQRRTVTDAFGRVTFYEYDGRARLKRITANQGLPDEHVTTYEYWPDNLLKTITKPNGTVTSYGYDRADRLTSIVVRRDAEVLASYAYTYDPNGNRLTQVETNGGPPETTTYTYDALNRLESVTYPGGASATYEYDAVGKLSRETERDASGVVVSDKTAAFDAVNRLGSITDLVDPSNNATLTYDRNGNLLSKTTAAGTEEYSHDARDLLVETREGPLVTARFAYDPFGRRYLKIGAEGLRQYLYDETSTLHELDGDDQEVAKYEYGPHHLESFVRRDEPRRFYHQDALGSPTTLTDATGTVVARYHLDAWGRYRLPSELEDSRSRFGFTGYLFDQETELYYAKARFYDPEIGRFTTQDSVLGQVDEPPSLNRYFYGNANPLRFVDPTGHQSAELHEEYRMYRQAQEAIRERNWCASQPEACATKRIAQAEADERSSNRASGVMRTIGGVFLIGAGLAGAPETAGLSLAASAAGIDQSVTGIKEVWTGESEKSIAGKAIEHSFLKAGATEVQAEERTRIVEAGILVSIGGVAGARGLGDDAARSLVSEPFDSGRLTLAAERSQRGLEAGLLSGAGAIRGANAPPPASQAEDLVTWVDEGGNLSAGGSSGMRPDAYRYQASAPGARTNRLTGRGQAPYLQFTDETGNVVGAKFDGVRGTELVDRKLNPVFSPKAVSQATRQAAVARHYGLEAVWELPTKEAVGAANRFLQSNNINGIAVRLVPQ